MSCHVTSSYIISWATSAHLASSRPISCHFIEFHPNTPYFSHSRSRGWVREVPFPPRAWRGTKNHKKIKTFWEWGLLTSRSWSDTVHLTLCHLVPYHVMSCHVILYHFMGNINSLCPVSCHLIYNLILPLLASGNLMSPRSDWFHVMSYLHISFHPTSSRLSLTYVRYSPTSCHAMSCHVMSFHFMSFHAILLHFSWLVSWGIVLCHAMSFLVSPRIMSSLQFASTHHNWPVVPS